MINRINATTFRRISVLGSLACSAALAFSCSSKTKESNVSGDEGTAAKPATAATGGASSVGGASGIGNTLNLGGDISKSMSKGPCMGLACQVPACEGAPKTTITGKVYDPAGKVPLYNVLVYIPNAPVAAFTEGATCDRCDASVLNPVASAVTDEAGGFVLTDAPAGANIPLVIQVGKWRRQLVIPAVTGCTDTPLMDPQMMRLPRNKAEGDLPRIAIAAGGADQMECLPRRLGIDDAEFTTSAGDGRIHLYSGADQGQNRSPKTFDASLNGGLALPPVTDLWASVDSLKKYDIVILSCEGGTVENQKPMAARQAMYDYASLGGRIFASHWHHIWFSQGPAPLPATGGWQDRDDPTAAGGPLDATIDQTFPKGAALAKWLVNVGATTTLGTMTVTFPRDNIQSVNPTSAREWITIQNPQPKYAGSEKAVEYMSFNAPVGAAEDQVCGRAVYTGLHVSATKSRMQGDPQPQGFPLDCEVRDLSAQEKAVAFMLFDLSACVQSEDKPPRPPK
jgi:hypothetical protein